jgi:hypothetical protein
MDGEVSGEERGREAERERREGVISFTCNDDMCALAGLRGKVQCGLVHWDGQYT